jgi:hypothetical protein
MSMAEETVRVFVGVDRSQLLAVKVLEHSIKRHTTARVEVTPMLDLPVPVPKDPRNGQRTGFSFSRFCIPKLAGYRGKAIYMDADMQVFKDIRDLWNIPFDGAKVVIQREVKQTDQNMGKVNAPKERKKQCAVMLLDCDRLDWKIEEIVQSMNEDKFSYDELMGDLCILAEEDVKYGVPFEWNSLEFYDENTCLLHYTDMGTQPWVSTKNVNGPIWFDEVRRMLADGSLTLDEIIKEVELGYFRPSLIFDVGYGHLVPKFLQGLVNKQKDIFDRFKGYVPHRVVYEAKSLRNKAIKEYERALGASRV